MVCRKRNREELSPQNFAVIYCSESNSTEEETKNRGTQLDMTGDAHLFISAFPNRKVSRPNRLA